jgi:hypothetical protein
MIFLRVSGAGPDLAGVSATVSDGACRKISRLTKRFPYAFRPGRSSDHVHTARTFSGPRAQSHHERPLGLEPGGNSFEAYSAAVAQQHQPRYQAPPVQPTFHIAASRPALPANRRRGEAQGA